MSDEELRGRLKDLHDKVEAIGEKEIPDMLWILLILIFFNSCR